MLVGLNFRGSDSDALVAQLVEQETLNLLVRGSNPCWRTIFIPPIYFLPTLLPKLGATKLWDATRGYLPC